ncbi:MULTISPECIES: lysophospholipid acyltransferase family protein [unclassified Leclercia]|uniref:L-ornithine N(alpha)-acyltransferase n=1 Tax=Leclercia barmai TaxID=2785629 RepID=A0ABS7S341_9ENTR|nr:MULTISPECIES: lysophospholipid acyltransferase family protein [unclassified Leclercia]MBZ0059976.1 lysophospholipid acyltransferase family protein [Leclercia sp. EMC7]MCM5697946.1 lysophospholipid acyltransferase family protein [Leclercia sp. LTM01]MCM5702474.1 lysophospholipid acyltransferase family protein [Leclercia sp. LTM14]
MDVIFNKVIREFFPDTKLPFWKNWLFRRAFCNKAFSRLIHDDQIFNKKGISWVNSVIDFFKVNCVTDICDYNNIPRHGAAVVISNHPTVMDGLSLIHTVSRVRKDIKIVANHILPIIFPQVSELTIGIQNMAGKMSHKKFREMNDHLKNGGVLIICPAGKLASWSLSGLQEHAWNPGFLQLAMRNDAALVPVHITGANSKTYYFMATIWRQLSNLMIIRESLRHRGKTIKVKIGQQICLSSFEKYNKDLSAAANACSMHLQSTGKNGPALLDTVSPQEHIESKSALINAIEECEILRQFNDGKKLLIYRRDTAGNSPIIDELGRLRERCYRDIGSGSGKDKDNDIFDDSYFHVILWYPSDTEILGAYRVIPVGEQLARKGVTGLYSNSLFEYHEGAYACLEKSVEIGRGFIQKPYQKSIALDYLWRGIFDFVKKHPGYKYLLGVLTIPGSFPEDIQKLIVNFYNIYFSTTNQFCTPVDLFTADEPQFSNHFSGKDFKNDWIMLNNLLRERGYELPWPFKQCAKWFSPGGSAVICFTKDVSFNSIAGLNLSDIEKLNQIYFKHYIKD